jgi:hypothetical protein
MTQKGRVSPFGDPRIKGCSPLPAAFRSVPRPSSPLSAKASTKCPYALDPKPVRRTQRANPPRPAAKPRFDNSALILPAWPSTSAAPREPNPHPRSQAHDEATAANGQSHSYPQCQRSESKIRGQRSEDGGQKNIPTAPRPRPNSHSLGPRRTETREHRRRAEGTALLLFSDLCALSSCLPAPGGADRDRTGDLLLAKQALSQLSYGPDPEDRGRMTENTRLLQSGPRAKPSPPSSSVLCPATLVGQGRFELPTSRLSSARSNQLSY